MTAFRSKWERVLGKCESPIEGMFLDALCMAALDHGYEVAKYSKKHEGVLIVGVQKAIGEKYRADFTVSYPFFGSCFSAAVECDGHEFHERTKRQAARDRSRDRALQACGYRVFRFTGSEINADARRCAAEVLDAVMEFQTSRIMKAMREQEEDAA